MSDRNHRNSTITTLSTESGGKNFPSNAFPRFLVNIYFSN